MLNEKIDGKSASTEDLRSCEDAIRQLHDLCSVHGDANKYNFVINRTTGRARLIDFEHCEPYEEQAALAELASLPDELAETTGRGASMPIYLDADGCSIRARN